VFTELDVKEQILFLLLHNNQDWQTAKLHGLSLIKVQMFRNRI